MNTHPTDQYLNRERLTDLAQFAVPDGHDLWPKIERAARSSASAITTPRQGILSLGLSHAWTAVGILLIAATFAALGIGLAFIALSSDQRSVPADQPGPAVTPTVDATSTPAPTPAVPTASPTQSVTDDPSSSQVSSIPSREASHAKLESNLSGETLDRYRALPPAYQEALGLYTWQTLPPDLVQSAVKDKIDQWGDAVIPLPDLLGEERAERFDGLQGEIVDHAQLLVSYYVLVLNTQSSDESRAEAMQQYVDYIAPPDTQMPSPSEPDVDTSSSAKAPMVAWPPLEKVLTKTAYARLDTLGPRIRERVIDIHAISSSGESDIETTAGFLTLYEMFLLKAQPGLEMPSLEDTLKGDDVATYRDFSEAHRKSADYTFDRGLFSLHYLGAAFNSFNSTIPEPTPELLAGRAAFAMEWVTFQEEPANARADLQSTLTGETLARYQALPEEYRVALDAYSTFGVSDDLIPTVVAEKMAQWPDNPEPIQDLLDPDRYAEFQELTAIHPQLGDEPRVQHHSTFFLAYYPYVLQTEDTLEGRKKAFAVLMDARTDKFSPGGIPQVPEPRLEDVIVPSAIAVLDQLGPRLREALTNRRSDEMVDVQSLAIELKVIEFMLLKTKPELEIPPLTQFLSTDDRDLYDKIPADIRKIAEWGYAQSALSGMLFQATSPEYLETSLPDEGYFTERAHARFEFARRLAEQREDAETGQDSSTDPTPTATPTTIPDTWVSKNGFIQFTTGEDPLDDPLPGTHEWCVHPSNVPKEPAGPWLVPSVLPAGMEQTVRDQISPHTMLRAFQNSTDRISMSQGLCATRQLAVGWYREIQIGDRTAYVTAEGKLSADGSTRVFDPNAASSLIMDIGYGVMSFNVFGSVTVDDLVSTAALLVPEELTGAEQGPYPQAVLDALGDSFGPVYVQGKLPDGYEMLGQLQARQEALGPRTTRLSYVRASDGNCAFTLNQAALRQQFPNVVQRAQRGDETSYTVTDDSGQTISATAKWGTVEIDGITLYAQEFSARPPMGNADVYFQAQGVWFDVKISTSPYCDHSLEMVAEIASSLEPLQP